MSLSVATNANLPRFSTRSALRASFSSLSRYIASFLSGSRLKISFVRSVVMAQPYSTVDVTATITKSDNSIPTISTITVNVLFPDGTTGSYSYPTDISNVGSGQFKLTYTTKGPGPHREVWIFTASDSSVGEFENTTYVSF